MRRVNSVTNPVLCIGRGLLIVLFSFFTSTSALAQNSISLSGKVIDAQTKEALAPVRIRVLGKPQLTMVTNPDGAYSINGLAPDDTLKFTILGYQTLQVKAANLVDKRFVTLRSLISQTGEVEISPADNPALRIIRNALNNKKVNNYERLPEYSYVAYNRFHVTRVKSDSSTLLNDTGTLGTGGGSIRFTVSGGNDSTNQIDSFFNAQHAFISESLTEVKFKAPDKRNTVVVASKVSGSTDARFALLGAQNAEFNIYHDDVKLLSKQYLSPLAFRALDKYYYRIIDTLYSPQGDTIFVISYKPVGKSSFNAFKGVLHITSNGWAVERVLAQPNKKDDGISLKLQQVFEVLPEGKWFPTITYSHMVLAPISGSGSDLVGIGRSYNRDISLNPELKNNEFSEVSLSFDPKSHLKSDSFWIKNRQDSLTHQDSVTYKVVDSVGKALHLDRKIRFAEALATGYLRFGFVELDLSRLYTYNQWEKSRVGLGFRTNDRLTKYAQAEVYSAYGFGDKKFKYGGDLKIIPAPLGTFRAGIFAFSDVREFAGPDWELWSRKDFTTENVRRTNRDSLLTSRSAGIYLQWQMFKYLRLKPGIAQRYEVIPSSFRYLNDSNQKINEFLTNEASLFIRYAYKEKVTLDPYGTRIVNEAPYPVLSFRASTPIPTKINNDYQFLETAARIDYAIKDPLLGSSSITIEGGRLFGDALLHRAFNFSPSRNKVRIESKNAFMTMGMFEFLTPGYLSASLNHSFDKLLRLGPKIHPILVLHHRSAMGMPLPSSKEATLRLPYKDGTKGYHESGLSIVNILNGPFSSIGVGVYFRYGPYTLPKFTDNFAIRLALKPKF